MANYNTFLKVIITFIVVVIINLSFITPNLSAQCPNIQLVDMRGIPGFPELDNMIMCNDPDTLSVLVFTDEPGQILGFELELNLLPGMMFAGFADSHNPGSTVSITDPDNTNPKFLLDAVGGEDIMVINIGVQANCNADIINTAYMPSFNYNYTFIDSLGNVSSCSGSDIFDLDMNNAIKEPILNFTTQSQTINVTNIGALRCRNIYISQNGIGAELDSFRLTVQGFDWNDWGVDLNEFWAGTRNNASAVEYTSSIEYNIDSTAFTVLLDGPAFSSQGTINDDNDQVFDEDEELRMQICYTLNECPDFMGSTSIPLTYSAMWGCESEVCEIQQQTRDFTSIISGDPEPVATSTLIRGLEVCNQTAQIQLDLSSDIANPVEGSFNDLKFGYETCPQPNLDVVSVSIGGTTLPTANFQWVNEDILIDLTTLTFDPDGAGTGVEDLDGDGFYDDLPGGNTVSAIIELDIACGVTVPVPTSVDCPEIDCGFAQAFISATRNCSESYTTPVPVTGFDLRRGPASKSLDETNLGGGIFGYAFPVETSDGLTTAWGTHDSPGTIDVEFCYQLEEVNVAGCSNDNTKLQITTNALEWMKLDLQLISATFDDGTGAVAAPTSKTTTATEATFIVDAGSNQTNVNMCYQLTFELDSCICSPEVFAISTFQVVESCDDCAPTCENVLACEKTVFSGNASCEDCPCALEVIVTETRRVNYGFTDKTMTTQQDHTTVDPMDLNRYIPGDTIFIETATVVNDPSVIPNLNSLYWRFVLSTTGTSIAQMRAAELSLAATDGEILSFSVKKAGSSIRTEIDVNSWTFDRVFEGSQNCHPIDFTGTTPWDGVYTNNFSANGSNSSIDYQDGTRPGFIIKNSDDRNDCGDNCEFGGNVVDQLIAEINWEQGDTLFLQYQFPLIKNLWREANGDIGNTGGFIIPTITWTTYDITGTNCVSGNESGCSVSKPIEMFCPGEVSAKSILSLDNCGGEINHVFEMTNLPPDTWYTNEFRPYIDITRVVSPVDGNLIYCGNPKATDCLGTAYDLIVESTSNLDCIENDAYCAVSTGSSGSIVFDPSGFGTTVLGFGLNNTVNDSLVISYDVCYLCPDALNDYNTYNLMFDWEARIGDFSTTSFVCGVQTGTFTLDECVASGTSWYDLYELDTLHNKTDRIGEIFLVDPDNRTEMAALSSTATPGGTLTSAVPGTSVEMQAFEFCVDGTDPLKPDHVGVVASITLTPSISLATVSSGGAALTFTLTNSTPEGNTYALSLPDMSPGDCTTLDIGTTFLYCPVAPDPVPQVCVNVTSGCLDFEIQAALLGGTTACSGTEECYFYAFEPAEIQAEWIAPGETEDYGLCDQIPFALILKNVRNPTVYNMILEWDLPLQGMQIVPGSFEISENNDGDLTLPFVNIPTDPTTTDGITYSYLNTADWSTNIATNGFEGVNTLIPNGNRFTIRFLAETTCDEFVSGSTMDFEGFSSDPCSAGVLSTGKVESNPIVINGADPAENALILNFASPEIIYCGGGTSEFAIAGINISDFSTGDSVLMCVNFPPEVTYVPNSLVYVVPNGQSLGTLTTTSVGTFTQICFDGPINLGPDQQYSLKLEAMVDPTLACGDIELGVDIKTVFPDENCSSQPDPCDVLVQNSLNDGVFIEVGPPIETVSMEVYQGCNATTGNTEICYNIELSNPAPTVYNSFVQLDILDDLQGNATADAIDPILGTFTHSSVIILPNESVMISGCIEVQSNLSCPILLNQTYDASCACENMATPISELPPQFVVENDLLLTCPSEPVELEICSNFTYTISDPAAVAIVENGNLVEFTLNDGFGVDAAETITVTGGSGDCSNTYNISLMSTGDIDLASEPASVCEGECVQLDLGIPANFLSSTTVSWMPTTGLDDPTSATPMVCEITSNVIYTATVTFGDACSENVIIPVTYSPKGSLTVSGFDVECIDMSNQPVFEATPGYDLYTWLQIINGNEIPIVVTTTNTLEWFTPGDYKVVASGGGFECPAESPVFNLTTDFLPQVCLPVQITKN